MPSNTSNAKTVLITGCSSGFGLRAAARLASKGYKVIATMRNLNKKEALLQEVKERGGEVDLYPLDVTDKETIKSVITDIGAKYGAIDVLVNNAGFGLSGFFEDLTDEEIREQLETNFFGVLNVTREVIPLMRQQKKGKIINISSVAGFSGSAALGAYNASKWALEGHSESLREELKFFNIDVLLIEPGAYKTKIFYENAHLGKNFHDKSSPYYPISTFLEKRVMDYLNDCFKDPEEIAIKIEKLINAKSPSFRTIPDIESRMRYFLRRFLPFRLYSWIVRRITFKGLNW